MAQTESPPPMMEMAALVGCNCLGDGVGADGEARKFEDARGTIPHDGLRGRDDLLIASIDLGPMSRPCQSAGKFSEESHG